MLPLLAWMATVGATPVFTNPMPMSPPATRRSSDCAVRPGDGGVGTTDELITYGGFNGATLNDVPFYRVLSNGWGSPLTAVLPLRERHAMAYDPENGFVAIVGGGNGFTVYDAVTLIDSANVVSVPTLPMQRPSARIDAALVWVPTLRQFVYFGGSANVFGTSHMNDLWMLDVADGGAGWKQPALTVTQPPSPRGAACLVYDPVRDQLVLFGGETNGPAHVNDTWTYALDGGGWAQQVVAGAPPTPRAFAGCEWERNLQQLIVYGGQATSGPMGGLFGYDPGTRQWVTYAPATSPGNLSDTAACWSPSAKGILFFGGRSAASTYVNTLWTLRFNAPPTVNAGPDQNVAEGTTVTLTGAAIDPESDPLTPQWLQTGGPAVTLTGAGLTRSFTAPSVAVDTTLTFSLTVSDGVNPGVADTVSVTVDNTINDVPTAFAGMDVTVDAGTTVTLVGSGFDPNNDPLTYQWSQLAGPGVTLTAPTSSTTSFLAPSPAVATILSFRLVVSDGMAPSLPDDVFVTVNPAPFVDAGTDAGVDAGEPDAGDVDAGTPDAGTPDAGTNDAGTPDAGTPDAGTPDAGTNDAGTPDAGTPDAGTPDAGTPDAGTPDAGTHDAGTNDAGTPDAGTPDAGTPDAGTPDAGTPDAGTDPRALSVGCGCRQVDASSTWLLALLALGWKRRRHR